MSGNRSKSLTESRYKSQLSTRDNDSDLPVRHFELEVKKKKKNTAVIMRIMKAMMFEVVITMIIMVITMVMKMLMIIIVAMIAMIPVVSGLSC